MNIKNLITTEIGIVLSLMLFFVCVFVLMPFHVYELFKSYGW